MEKSWCNLHSDSTETEWICSVRQVIISAIVICYVTTLMGSGMGRGIVSALGLLLHYCIMHRLLAFVLQHFKMVIVIGHNACSLFRWGFLC